MSDMQPNISKMADYIAEFKKNYITYYIIFDHKLII